MALLARNEERLQSALDEVRAAGGDGTAIPVDVSNADEVMAAARRVEAELGPIEVWVNDAMATVFGPVSSITPDEYRRVTEVTYLGTINGTLAALEQMRPRDRGVIIQVGSGLAYRSIPLQAAYCGAKHAILGFTESLRTELIHEGSNIRVTMVQLSSFNTPQFSWCRTHLEHQPQPLPPIYEPEIAARAIVWASHQRKREVYVGRTAVTAITWNKFLPGLLDRALAATAYGNQITERPADPQAPGNLFSPGQGDYAAHGAFDSSARKVSRQLQAAMSLGVPVVTDTLFAVLGGMQQVRKSLPAVVRMRRNQRRQAHREQSDQASQGMRQAA